MTYAAIHTMSRAARTDGDVRGRIEVGFVAKAAARLPVVANDSDQRERKVIGQVLDGTFPAQWVLDVLLVLDNGGQLSNPTDAQVNAAIDVAWAYFIGSR